MTEEAKSAEEKISETPKVETTVSPKKVRDPSLDRRTLFVRSIPNDATNDTLSEFFSQFVPVKHAVVVKDKEGSSRGFGFVSFQSDDDAVTALEKSKKTKFGNRLLSVDIAKRRARKGKDDDVQEHENMKSTEAREEENVRVKTAKIIVRNLPWSVRDANELSKLFKKYGTIKDSCIPRKNGGKMSGFGFVTMSKHAAALKAVEGSKGLKIGGRRVTVALAIDKNHWEKMKAEKKHLAAEKKQKRKAHKKATAEDGKPSEEKSDEEKPEEEKSDDKDDKSKEGEAEDDEKINFEPEDNEEKQASKKPRVKKNRQEKYCIFIRNLPYDATQEALEEHFKKLGDIKYALPVMDKETGLAKGTAFVAFENKQPYEECLLNAPDIPKDSVLLPDDVSPFYVFEGRVMQIAPAVDRESALKLTERHAKARAELFGREPHERDKRRLFLLNEGRIAPESKLADLLSTTDMEIREQSYKARIQQLNSNPSLHLSMTRLAIRNIPRAVNDKALKALGRKAIVEFAKEVKDGKRHPLNKEELDRSKKHAEWIDEKMGITPEDRKSGKVKSKHGVVVQSKIINEIKGSGEYGRSRGYGFLEFRDHRSALMALRWLNAHQVTTDEILSSLTDEEKKIAEGEKLIKRKRLVVEFAIENANVIKRRLEQISNSKRAAKRERDEANGVESDPKRQHREGRRGGKSQNGNHHGFSYGREREVREGKSRKLEEKKNRELEKKSKKGSKKAGKVTKPKDKKKHEKSVKSNKRFEMKLKNAVKNIDLKGLATAKK
ncbi:NOP4 [Brettanomyces bruxellensis]|uniref:DEBR0S3_14356g1_1 n=2 Tax=Dekkera bruxellensis TaxID=5007 RepID=A0A3F2Y4S0_DEKBR|nr:NOP4 [Brettanomyces bruxellensis]